ncbi:MAG: SoxR reducing system RseC family protein [Planctomycetia bacterium]|nr:SoxR reducing system RseC family protein [Planctomycetia bacterium]
MFKQRQIIEKGIIKYTNGNRATVELIKPDSQECKSCGVCMGIENKSNLLEVNAFPGLNEGQQVTLKIIEYSPYKAMFFVLILPVISLIIGGLLGGKLYFIYPNSQDVRMISCGFIFFIVSILAISIYDKKIRNKKNIHREIISIDIQNNFNPVAK